MKEDNSSGSSTRIIGAAARFIVGAGLLGFLLWKTPLLECLHLALYIVLIPAVFLVSIGLISKGTLEFVMMGAQDLRTRVEEHISKIREQEQAAA